MTPRLPVRAGAVTLLAATMLAVAGCSGVGGKLTFNDTEKVKITDIVLDGHSADITVRTAAIAETRITRIVRDSGDPERSYRIDGTTLFLDSRCGPDCQASYQVEAPTGVKVRGTLSSGTVTLTEVGATDVTLTSGDVVVRNASGPVTVTATSGDITVDGARGAKLSITSGDVTAQNITGPVTAKVNSGDMNVQLAVPAAVTAEVGSGDLNLEVPSGAYRVRTHRGSGDIELNGITDNPAGKDLLDLRVDSGDLTVVSR